MKQTLLFTNAGVARNLKLRSSRGKGLFASTHYTQECPSASHKSPFLDDKGRHNVSFFHAETDKIGVYDEKQALFAIISLTRNCN